MFFTRFDDIRIKANSRTNNSMTTKILDSDDIQIIDSPGVFGVRGYSLVVVRSEKMSIPVTSVQLPKLPRRRASIILYLCVPRGKAEQLKATGGTAEFVLKKGNKSIGGQVRLADLRVTTSSGFSGERLYSSKIWVESLDNNLNWQPEIATVAVNVGDHDIDGPIEAMIRCGGEK